MVAFSTTEAEYITTTHASKEEVYLQQLFTEIWFKQQAIRLSCDTQSAIFLVNNPTYHSKTNHIDVQYHFVREMIGKGKVLLEKVDTVENVPNLLTKSVSRKMFTW